MRHIILYPGSFNPIHKGHTAVARYVLESGYCDELWFVVSPQNPHKKDMSMAPDTDRLEMVRSAAAEELAGLPVSISDIEFAMPKPSYTADTVRALSAKFPDCRFSILAGTDILANLDRWKDAEWLMQNICFYIYPREGYPYFPTGAHTVWLEDAPTWDHSSTQVRERICTGGVSAVRHLVSPPVVAYISSHGLYTGCPETGHPESAATRPDDANLTPEETGDLVAEGKRLYKVGDYGNALNIFLRAESADPGNVEVREFIKLIRDIFEFRYMDYYNP